MEVGDGLRCVGDEGETAAEGVIECGSKTIDVRSGIGRCATS